MAFVALSQGKLLNMLRSAALLSPIAHLNMITSELTKLIAELFLANVSDMKKIDYVTNNCILHMHIFNQISVMTFSYVCL